MLHRNRRSLGLLSLAPVCALFLGGCNLVLGLGDFSDGYSETHPASPAGGGSSVSSTASGSGSGSGGGSGGHGGQGGSGGGPTTSATGSSTNATSSGTGGGGNGGGSSTPLTVSPDQSKMGVLRALGFTASTPVTWSIQEAGGGKIDANGRYLSPETPGTYHVVATSKADSSETATATVTVAPLGITVVGGLPGGRGTIDGTGARARFSEPGGIGLGNSTIGILVADTDNQTIRRIVNNKVTTLAGHPLLAGSTDGVGDAARFSTPTAIAFDAGSNKPMWVLDGDGTCIRQVNGLTGDVVTLAGKCGEAGVVDHATGAAARFQSPAGMAYSSADNALYLCAGSTIRRVDVATGATTTVVTDTGGSCRAIAASYGVFFATSSGLIKRFYVGSSGPMQPCTEVGEFPCITSVAQMNSPYPSTIAVKYDEVYVNYSDRLDRCPIPNDGTVATCQPSLTRDPDRVPIDGPLVDARVGYISALVADSWDVYFADSSTIRKLAFPQETVSTLAGAARNGTPVDGPRAKARLTVPTGVVSGDNGEILVADAGFDGPSSNTIRAIDASTGAIRTLAGKPRAKNDPTIVDGLHDEATFGIPWAMVRVGGELFVVDLLAQAIRRVDIASGTVSTFAGTLSVGGFQDGFGVGAQFSFMSQIFGAVGIATDGTYLYVSDSGNFAIRRITIATGEVITLAGGTKGTANGVGPSAQFMAPCGIAYDNGALYVADAEDLVIRRIDLQTKAVSSFLGISGNSGGVDGGVGVASFTGPASLVADGMGNLYVIDSSTRGSFVRRIDIANRQVSRFAGAPDKIGLAPGPLPSTINAIFGLSVDESGDLLFADGQEAAVGAIRPL